MASQILSSVFQYIHINFIYNNQSYPYLLGIPKIKVNFEEIKTKLILHDAIKEMLRSRYCHAGQDIMLGLDADEQAADETLPNRQGVRNCWTRHKKIHKCDSSQCEKLKKVTDSNSSGCWLLQMVMGFLHEKQTAQRGALESVRRLSCMASSTQVTVSAIP